MLQLLAPLPHCHHWLGEALTDSYEHAHGVVICNGLLCQSAVR